MKSITIHNLDETLENLIKERAKKQGKSLNKTIKALLNEALGKKDKTTHDHTDDFIDLFGVWTDKDFDDFKKNTESFNKIDETDWK